MSIAFFHYIPKTKKQCRERIPDERKLRNGKNQKLYENRIPQLEIETKIWTTGQSLFVTLALGIDRKMEQKVVRLQFL